MEMTPVPVGMPLQIKGLDAKQQAWFYNTRSEGKWLDLSES